MSTQDTPIEDVQRSVLFSGLAPEELAAIIRGGRWLNIDQDHFVYRQGDKGHCFYIIASGEAELLLNAGSASQISVGHIGHGGHFGETSILTNSSNSLSVLAISRLTLLCFDAISFKELLLANPIIQQRLAISLAQRLRISFLDHANALIKRTPTRKTVEHNLDSTFFASIRATPINSTRTRDTAGDIAQPESSLNKQISRAIHSYSNTLEPLLITGESGTGRRMVAYEIHAASSCSKGPYSEVDIRTINPLQMEEELLGYGIAPLPFSQTDQFGIFERTQGGTVVLYNAEHLDPDIQRQLADLIKKTRSKRAAGHTQNLLRSRIILICKDEPRQQDGHKRLLPTLYSLLANHHFKVAPLREHRRDIPRLVDYYLKRYSLQYGKNIPGVDQQTLGKFINYDWPGNLTEMASVLQRAVIIGKNHEPLTDELLLGVPRSEGKWEFNLLRFKLVRTLISSRLFPLLPRAVVGIFFVLVLLALFFGPITAEENIGITLSWVVGWPLLIFAFFFLARTWCSICGLSVPGWLAQTILKPERSTPKVIKRYSGWIMTILCILLFWIEITWNAYQSPRLTAWIIFSITISSLLFSIFYKRRVWCRYLCPLGAINALFSMPSILELRSNRHLCMNRCDDHACYTGDERADGCPMFRHPFLVDNNRDCILCGQCIKNCKHNAIHLNLRLAPQELWSQQAPRLADSFLVVSLAAILYPFTITQKYPFVVQYIAEFLTRSGLPSSRPFATSVLFFSCITIYLSGYCVMSRIVANITGSTWKTTASILGYGMIPLVLGAFMAAHLEIFIQAIWLLPANLMDLFGVGGRYTSVRLISDDATLILQIITLLGALIAALYASRRILQRLLVGRHYRLKMFSLPALLLCLSAIAYLQLV